MSNNYTRRVSILMPAVTPANTEAVTIGASHAESAVIAADAVRLIATAACYVTFGTAPVATAASMFLPANVPELFQFASGDKVSVLQVSGGGTLYVSWGN
jgi:hypothetical protein